VPFSVSACAQYIPLQPSHSKLEALFLSRRPCYSAQASQPLLLSLPHCSANQGVSNVCHDCAIIGLGNGTRLVEIQFTVRGELVLTNNVTVCTVWQSLRKATRCAVELVEMELTRGEGWDCPLPHRERIRVWFEQRQSHLRHSPGSWQQWKRAAASLKSGCGCVQKQLELSWFGEM